MPNLRRASLQRLSHWFQVALPQACFVCGGRAVGQLCGACITGLPAAPHPACPSCGEASPGGMPCGRCLQEPPRFDATRAALRYDFPVREWVQALKYQARLPLAREAARLMRPLLADLRFDCVVPVPLHVERLASRGFNQAVLLAAPLARAAGVPLWRDAIVKDRLLPAQAALDREARRRNLVGAFRAVRRFDGARVLVVDDVMTTGTTLDEVAAALKAAGASWVGNLVFARTCNEP